MSSWEALDHEALIADPPTATSHEGMPHMLADLQLVTAAHDQEDVAVETPMDQPQHWQQEDSTANQVLQDGEKLHETPDAHETSSSPHDPPPANVPIVYQAPPGIARVRLFDDNLACLKVYKNAYGNCNVPKEFDLDPKLGKWVSQLKGNKMRSKLTDEQRERLQQLGFDWETRAQKIDREWEANYQLLVDFKAQHGHCRVLKSNAGLGRWVSKQRENHTNRTLRQDRVQRLTALGFVWKRRDGPRMEAREKEDPKWEQMFRRLLEFHAEHGHCFVPPSNFEHDPDRVLFRWVARQRADHNQHGGRLPRDRKQRLDALGFCWRVDPSQRQLMRHQDVWEDRFTQLLEFHKEHGHARVPFTSKHQALAKWVQFQVQSGRAGTLDATRAQKLETVGLVWGRNDEQGWNANYEKLKTHRRMEKLHDNRHKPITDAKVADWMRRQVWDHKRGRLTEERRNLLDEIDFFTDTPQEALVSRSAVHRQVEQQGSSDGEGENVDKGKHTMSTKRKATTKHKRKILNKTTKSKTKQQNNDDGSLENSSDEPPMARKRTSIGGKRNELPTKRLRGSADSTQDETGDDTADVAMEHSKNDNLPREVRPKLSGDVDGTAEKPKAPQRPENGAAALRQEAFNHGVHEKEAEKPSKDVAENLLDLHAVDVKDNEKDCNNELTGEVAEEKDEDPKSNEKEKTTTTGDQDKQDAQHGRADDKNTAMQRRLPVGTPVRKRFPNKGWCIGQVQQHINPNTARVLYDNGEEEDLSEDELDVAATAYDMHEKKQSKADKKPRTVHV